MLNYSTIDNISLRSDNKIIGLSIFVILSSLILDVGIYYSISLILLISILNSVGKNRFKIAIKNIKPLFLLPVFGLIFSLDNSNYEVLKDFWYLSKIYIFYILGFLLGIQIIQFNKFISYFIIIGIIFALKFIIIFNYNTGSEDSIFTEASLSGRLPLVFTIILPFLILNTFINNFTKKINFKGIIFIIIVLSIIFSYSRILIISTILIFLSALGLFDNNKKTFFWMLFIFCLLIAFFGLLPEYNPNEVTMFGKISNSIAEISLTEGIDSAERISNWRGFEAYHAIDNFEKSSLFQMLFGRGLGSQVDLGVVVEMNNYMEYRYLPHIHNGFLYVITKYGLLGLFFYLLFICKLLFIKKNKSNIKILLINRLIYGMAVVILLSTAVITGLFNLSILDPFCFMLGILCGQKELLNNLDIQ
jgi:hypothetical protein